MNEYERRIRFISSVTKVPDFEVDRVMACMNQILSNKGEGAILDAYEMSCYTQVMEGKVRAILAVVSTFNADNIWEHTK